MRAMLKAPPQPVSASTSSGKRAGIGNAADVDQHIIHGADPQIRDTQGIGRDAAAGEIQRLEAARRGHARGVCVDGADDLQGFLIGDGSPQPGARG